MGIYEDMDTFMRLQPRSDKSWMGNNTLQLVGSDTVRAIYPAGSASPTVATSTGAPYGGGQRLWYLPRPSEQIALEYDAYFMPGFDFVKGGKMGFGFWGGDNFDGGKRPDGTDGLSGRIMWRADPDPADGVAKGDGEIYLYSASAPAGSIDTGKGFSVARGAFQIAAGVKARYGLAVKLNTPGIPDGRLAASVNGVRFIYADNVMFRTVPTLKIEGLILSTFFGGGTEEWVTPVDQWAEFGNVMSGEVASAASVRRQRLPSGVYTPSRVKVL